MQVEFDAMPAERRKLLAVHFVSAMALGHDRLFSDIGRFKVIEWIDQSQENFGVFTRL
jgi:hypothetical protein